MKKCFSLKELKKNNQTLADFLRMQKIRLILPCGGMGTCGKCLIRIEYQTGSQVLKTVEVPACQTTTNALLDKSPKQADQISIQIEESSILHISEKHTEKNHGRPFYAAVDLGSTTIETAAITEDGHVIGSVRKRNPQVSYGADVLSRIKAASESRMAASDMQRLAESTIQSELSELSSRYGLSPQPEKMAVAGNTTMGHLLEGRDVKQLGEAPFDPGDISFKDISTIFFDDSTPVYLLPGISAFVGGDIVSGIYSLDMDLSEDTQMLVDLGTNGEMVLGNRHEFLVTSTAAGPAFEAANISCGVPGIPGAIQRVRFSAEKPVLTLIPWETDFTALSYGERMQAEIRLRSRRPSGLCGSGLISAVSGMKKAGIIDDTGTLTREEWIKNGFPLWKPSPANRGAEPLTLTQDDIHELLLAKAAVRSGIEILIKEAGKLPAKVYLSGGFGSAISSEDASSIGLFPEDVSGRIIASGNTSLSGAEKLLREDSPETRRRLSMIRDKSSEIVLADEPDFESLYVSQMRL